MFEKTRAFVAQKKDQAAAFGALAVTGIALPAHAQTTPPSIDTTAVTDFISGDVIAGIAAVGAVMLLVAATFAGFRWVRGAAGGN